MSDREFSATDGRRSTQYDGFISYSHDADVRLAQALEHGLGSLAKPWYIRRGLKIFRDQTSLAATPELWSTIERALIGSRFFVLLASPEAAGRPYVNREVAWWLEHRSARTLLIGLAGGELAWDDEAADFDVEHTDALPPALGRSFDEEPFWVDFRWTRDEQQLSLRDPQFRDRVAELAAPLRGLSKDDLIGEDLRQHRRSIFLARLVAAVLILLLAAAIAAAVIARGQRNEARRERRLAETRASIATSRELAATARSVARTDYDLALLLAVEAARRARTAEAQGALITLLRDSPLRATLLDTSFNGWMPFSSDGHLFVTLGRRDVATVREATTGKPLRTLQRAGRVESATFGSTGGAVLTIGADGAVRIVDRKSDKTLAIIRDRGARIRQAAWRDDERAVLTLADDGTLKSWKPDSTTPTVTFRGGADRISNSPFSSDGRRIVATYRGRVHVWNADTGRLVAVLGAKNERICAASFSPSGSMLASLSSNERIRVWDPQSRHSVRSLGPARFISLFSGQHRCYEYEDVAFSPDGRFVFANATPWIWDWENRRPLTRPHDFLGSTVFSADGRFIATIRGAEPSLLRVWDIAGQRRIFDGSRRGLALSSLLSGDAVLNRGGTILAVNQSLESSSHAVRIYATQQAPSLEVLPSHTAEFPWRRTSPVSSVGFSPDGQQLITAGEDREARVWDARTGRGVRILGPHPGRVNSAIFSPDGRSIFTGSDYGGARLWDAGSGRLAAKLGVGRSAVSAAAFSSNSKIVAVAQGDGRIRLWNVSTGRGLRVLRHRGNQIDAITFSRDGRLLLTASSGGTERLWDARSGRLLHTVPARVAYHLAFSADNRLFAAPKPDGHVQVWDVALSKPVAFLSGHTRGVTSFDFSNHGRRLVTASLDGTARLWNLHDHRPRPGPVLRAGAPLFGAEFSPDDSHVLTYDVGGSSRVWDAQTGRELAVMRYGRGFAVDSVFDPTGRKVAAVREDGAITIWRSNLGRRLAIVGGATDYVGDVAYAKAGSLLVVSADDGTVRMIDSHTGRTIVVIHGVSHSLRTLNLSPDGRRVLLPEADFAVGIWSVTSGRRLITIHGHSDQINDASFSRDGIKF